MKLLILRLGSMGDILHALPAVAALRRAQPETEIAWIVEPRWAELLPGKPWLDRVHIADTRGWRKHVAFAPRSVKALRSELRSVEYDIAVDLQGLLKSAVIARLSGARRRWGFADPREKLARVAYTQTTERGGGHVMDQNLRLLSAAAGASLVAPSVADPHLLPRDPAAEQWAESELAARGLTNKRFALLSPAAGWPAKEWPAERYGGLAHKLAQDGIASILNVGPGERETALADLAERSSNATARRITATITQLIALTRRAALFIGGDTGPMHLANALGVPVVALFGPTDPARNGPYFQPRAVLRHPLSVTSYSHTDAPDPGLLAIKVDEVLAAARELLDSTRLSSRA